MLLLSYELNQPVSSRNSIFALKKKVTLNLWLFRPGYLANSFSRMKEVNLSLQGNFLAKFVAVIKFTRSSENSKFETLISGNVTLDSLPIVTHLWRLYLASYTLSFDNENIESRER